MLEQYRQRAKDAHRWTSFDPDKRGDQLISEFSAQLAEDIETLNAAGITVDVVESYKEGYIKRFTVWLSAKSNCISSMITGPARFPVRKAEAASNREHALYTALQEWRDRTKKAILKKAEPEKTFLSEIERYKEQLETLKTAHEKMKEGNRRIKEAKKSGQDISEYLMQDHGIPAHMIEWTMRFGFGLANNLANIRRIEGRIIELEKKEVKAEIVGENIHQFEGFKVVYNYEADRIQIIHDQKPDDATRWQLKSNGFRWSPTFGAWQRNLNANGKWAAERVLKIELPKI